MSLLEIIPCYIPIPIPVPVWIPVAPTKSADPISTFAKKMQYLLQMLLPLGLLFWTPRGKFSRLLLMIKGLDRSMRKLLSPRSIQLVKLNRRTVGEDILSNVNAYLAAYVMILVSSFLLLSLDSFSVTTNLSAAISCFNNIGPGLEAVGPACNYGGYSAFSKLVLSFDMLLGRLEIFPMLLIFRPQTWRRSA